MSNRSTLRYEAALKVTGSAVYEAEVPAADLLHAALVEASISCGDVLSVDATQAVDVPGFAAMVSYIDAEVLQASPATALIRERIIHFAGQPVALVTANTLQAAREAARTTKLTTQVRPAVTALEQALDKSFAPAMVGRFPAETHRGDGSRALAEADLVVRHRYETAVNNHHPMEPHAVVCWWEGGKAVVHTSTQAIFGTRAMIAHAFQMPASDIRVISRFLGGGFGCKGQLWWPWMFWAMLASRKTGRPVRLELTRAQMFTLVGRRQETVQDLGLGFSVDGRLTVALIVLALSGIAFPSDLIGQASTIDGDTLEIHGTRIRLWGIDAPESSQLCRGEDSLQYRCGAKAANDLFDFIAKRTVECQPVSFDQYGRTVATCSVGGTDLGEWLISHGLALDWPKYSKGRYEMTQQKAKTAERGLWAGSYIEPWLYRACIRQGGKPIDCSDDATGGH